MGNIVGKPFGVVASKDYNTALTESVKEGNQAKFYLTENGGKGFNDITATTDNSRNTLIVNGNKIQGVSTSDINKLNAITSDTAKIFKYKGSVDLFESLPNIPNNVNVGDVYNISNKFNMDGVSYPAHTNVVCVESVLSGSLPIVKWDALGGTMEIGTSVDPSINTLSSSVCLSYKTINNIPISSFGIKVDTDSYLDATDDGTIYLHVGSSYSHKYNDNCIRFSANLGLMEYADLYVKDGIKISSFYNNEGVEIVGLSLKISTNIDNHVEKITDVSGLTIDDDGLRLALATGDSINNGFINGLVTITTNVARKGGLSIYGAAIEDYLRMSSYTYYVNSSIKVEPPLYKDRIEQDKINLNLGSGLIIGSNNELTVPVGKELKITNSNLIKLNANYLSGTVKDVNNFYYSLGGIYFPDTIKSGQKNDNITVGPSQTGLKKNYGLILRCGTGLAFQEGYEDFGDNSSQILGHDGRYYVNIDNTTIGLNTNSKLRVKHDSTLSESSNGLSVKVGNNLVTGDDGINIQLPVPTPSDLQQLPVSTAGILVNDGNNGLCVDIPALKRLVELIMAAK